MGLFDFVTDLVGDVVGGVVEGATELVGDVVDGVTDTVGGLFSDSTVGFVEEAVEDVVETGTGVVVGAASGFVGGVRKGMNRASEKKIAVKDDSGQEKEDEIDDLDCESEYWDREEEERQKKFAAKVHNEEKAVDIKVTTWKELWTGLNKLREKEDRKIDEIKRNGNNLMANVTDTLFSSPKKTKLWGIAKSISGKTREEKLQEVIDEFDEKRAKYIDRIIVPIDSDEMWEMYEIAIRLNKQPGLGTKERIACRNLLERVTDECEMRFIENDAKMALIINAKKKYLN